MTMTGTEKARRVTGGEFLLQATDAAEVFVPEAFDEDARMLADSVEEFVRDRVLPDLERIDAQEDGLLERLVREAGELGVFAVDAPESFGGLGAPKTTAILVAEKIGLGASFAPAVAVQTGIGGLPILYFGTDEQRAPSLDHRGTPISAALRSPRPITAAPRPNPARAATRACARGRRRARFGARNQSARAGSSRPRRAPRPPRGEGRPVGSTR